MLETPLLQNRGFGNAAPPPVSWLAKFPSLARHPRVGTGTVSSLTFDPLTPFHCQSWNPDVSNHHNFASAPWRFATGAPLPLEQLQCCHRTGALDFLDIMPGDRCPRPCRGSKSSFAMLLFCFSGREHFENQNPNHTHKGV